MNLILHQFKTDALHFRWRLALLWLSFAVEVVLANTHLLSSEGIGISNFLLALWQVFFTAFLLASLIQTDALVGTTASWLTRPMRRGHLFWAKTAFIVACILIPILAIQIIGWINRGYSPHLLWVAIEQSLLFSVGFLAVVSLLASLTRNLPRFFLATGIMVAFIFAASLAVDMLVRANILKPVTFGWPQEQQRHACASVVCWLVLGTAALLGWVLQARAALWRSAAICLAAGFLAFPVISTIWWKDFLPLKWTPSAPLTLSLNDTSHPLVSTPQSQILSTELSIVGAPDRQVASIRNVSGSILFKGDRKATSVYGGNRPINWHKRPAETLQRVNYFDVIGGFFPTNTIWFNEENSDGIGNAFFNQAVNKRFPHGPPAGNLDGQATVDLFSVKKVAEIPLRPAEFQAFPGLRITVNKVSVTGSSVSLSIDECMTSLMFDRNVDTDHSGNLGSASLSCTYVLYHPQSGEAYVVSQQNAFTSFPPFLSGESISTVNLQFPYPALRERFAGITAADWLRDAHLCVFVPVYAGTSHLSFHQDNYQWTWKGPGDLRQKKEDLADAQAIAGATLPPSPTAAQLDAYLDEILLNTPRSWNDRLDETYRNKLAALGTNGLPALLRRLPLSFEVEANFVLPFVSKFVTRDQLPDLQAALQRDDQILTVFHEKHWQDDARSVLVTKLTDHRQPFSADALCIAAQAKDPATYPDLRWHFIHLEGSQDDQVVAALRECPGFDTDAAIRDAWQYVRLGVFEPGSLAAIAAAQGLPDALHQAVIHAELQQKGERNRDLKKLAALTGYNGPANDTLTWLASNLGRFQYDASQQHYVLAPAQ